jgi:hypothetical protein
MTSALPYHENDRQQSVNNFWSWVLRNQDIAQIHEPIIELLTAFLGYNKTYKRKNMDCKIINITVRGSPLIAVMIHDVHIKYS